MRGYKVFGILSTKSDIFDIHCGQKLDHLSEVLKFFGVAFRIVSVLTPVFAASCNLIC